MSTNQAWVDRQEASYEARRFHEQDRLVVWTMDSLAGLMEEKGVTKADLARTLGTSRAYISQLFSGSRNPTLATIADLAWALGQRACVKMEPLRSGQFMSAPLHQCSVVTTLPKRPAMTFSQAAANSGDFAMRMTAGGR